MIYWVCTKNENSGLYHYSKKLLNYLKDFEIEWVEDAFGKEKNLKIYHLGNHNMNSKIYVNAYEEPGVIVLHDLNLHHPAFSLGKKEFFEFEELPFFLREKGCWLDIFEIFTPAISNLLKKQKFLVVHSLYGVEVIKMFKIETPIFYIPMGVEIPEDLEEKIPFSIGIFGHRGINRNLKKTSEIILKLKKEFPQMVCIICGGGLKEGMEKIDFADYYENLPSKEFYKLLSKIEILFNWRYPVYGETSLSTLEAMAREVLPLVSSYGSYNELGSAIKVKEIEDSFFEIKKLWECPLTLRVLSKNVREFVKKNNSIEIWVNKWEELLCGLKK